MVGHWSCGRIVAGWIKTPFDMEVDLEQITLC